MLWPPRLGRLTDWVRGTWVIPIQIPLFGAEPPSLLRRAQRESYRRTVNTCGEINIHGVDLPPSTPSVRPTAFEQVNALRSSRATTGALLLPGRGGMARWTAVVFQAVGVPGGIRSSRDPGWLG